MIVPQSNITAGKIHQAVTLPGMRLIEASYPAGLDVPLHCHAAANFTVVLAGELEERSEGNTQRCEAGSFVSKPAGTIHSNRFGPSGARTFLLELIAHPRFTGGSRSASVWKYHWASGGRRARTMLRLFETFRAKRPERLNAAVNSALHSVVDESIRVSRQTDPTPPGWLVDICVLIEDRIAQPIRIRDLARAAGVHPVYLARAFRRFHGVSATEYVRRRRAVRVATRLSTRSASLCEIAGVCGFADQAHMTRTFKSQLGLTPGAFRRLLA
jgi:AraC family transcriptional regulator